MSDQPNFYAAPSPGTESGASSGFRLSDELRRQIVGVARIMLLAGGLQLLAAVLTLRDGFTVESLVGLAIRSVIPLFIGVAGVTLLGIHHDPGNDLPALTKSFRQLQVAFVVKGLALVSLIVLGLLSLVLGFGSAMF